MARSSSSRPKSSKTKTIGQEVKDIVIPVLGPTGSGKSTFVNHVIGTEKMKVGDRTTSCTTKPCPAYVIPIPHFPNLKGYRVVLLDTPGFDDTFVDDVEVLRGIANWLAESRRKGAFVGGVLYLHDISTKRLTSTARKNLEMFTRLCGEDSMKKTVLVTTNWDSGASNELYIKRETEIIGEHWMDILEKGGKVHRFLRNRRSAWAIIDTLLQSADFRDPLLLQKQLVDHKIPFTKTEVGKYSVSVAEEKRGGRKEEKGIMDRLGCVVQ